MQEAVGTKQMHMCLTKVAPQSQYSLDHLREMKMIRSEVHIRLNPAYKGQSGEEIQCASYVNVEARGIAENNRAI